MNTIMVTRRIAPRFTITMYRLLFTADLLLRSPATGLPALVHFPITANIQRHYNNGHTWNFTTIHNYHISAASRAASAGMVAGHMTAYLDTLYYSRRRSVSLQ
jgi:hypothetical protein